MNYRIVLSPDAQADIGSVIQWYDRIDPKLALRFRLEMRTTLRRITHLPHAFPIVANVFRRSVLNRFPYSVYYSVQLDVINVRAFCISAGALLFGWIEVTACTSFWLESSNKTSTIDVSS